MRFFGTATVLITLLTLTGCGSGDGDADDVPTITTRPSATSSSAPTSTATTGEPASEPPSASTTEPAPSPTETAGPSPEPPTDDPVGPTTYRQAQSRLTSQGTGEPVTRARFATSDDVVYCLLDDPVIGPACELRRGFIKDDDACGGGTADGVGRIETFEDRARPVCNTDTIREPGADEIAGDGVVAASGDVRCLVETVGVTCLDTGARTGFFLAPGEYHVF